MSALRDEAGDQRPAASGGRSKLGLPGCVEELAFPQRTALGMWKTQGTPFILQGLGNKMRF